MGSIFKRVLTEVEHNREIILKGGVNAIPWLSLPKFSSVIPGVRKGRYYIVTANSKVGKTQLADFLFVLEPLKWLEKYPKTNLKPRIFYFSLEMSKEDKIGAMICHKLYLEHGKRITVDELNSAFKDRTLDAETLDQIRGYKEYFEAFVEERLHIIDNIKNPFGIFKYMREYAESHGHYIYKTEMWTNNETGEKFERKVVDYYVPDDPDEIVIVLTDHYAKVTPEKGSTLHQAISDLSNYYMIMRDKWKYAPVGVQQQAAESEKQQFTMYGNTIVNKLKPSPDGLGDNKLTQRDADILIGLFAPNRYGIENYDGFDISVLKDHYRELIILLNRRGSGNASTDLFFDGAVNYFAELPPADSDKMEVLYKRLSK